MSSDIVLTSALRTNLQSLQNTQRLIDTTQQRLATGLRVSSALDNPQNFFTAQSLNNRAGDLSRLLDGIGQSLRSIQEADTGVTALSSLIDQANAIVSSARDTAAASEGEARLISSLDLSDIDDLTSLGDGNTIVATDTFAFITTDDDGERIVQQVAIGAGTIANFAANITNAFADDENGEIIASVNENGNLVIESKGGRTFTVEATDAAGTGDVDAQLVLLGLDDQFVLQDRTYGGNGTGAFVTGEADVQAVTVVGGNTLSSISLFEGTGDLIEAGDNISSVGAGNELFDAAGNIVSDEVSQLDVNLEIDGTVTTITGGATFQSLIDAINTNTTVNTDVRAEFDSLTGQIRLTALTDDVENVTFEFTTGANGIVDFGLGDASGNLDSLRDGAEAIDRDETATSVIDVGAGLQQYSFSFNSSTQELDRLSTEYNALRSQIDGIVKDASYRGINLLQGDDLVTFFNEDNSNSIRTEGEDFTSVGLGLNEANFRSKSNIEITAGEIASAQTRVRAFGSELANDLAVIQTRRTFTESTISTLEAGAADLTIADANEEGANLLALQTRQALGTTALSLASQSAQSVLRLF